MSTSTHVRRRTATSMALFVVALILVLAAPVAASAAADESGEAPSRAGAALDSGPSTRESEQSAADAALVKADADASESDRPSPEGAGHRDLDGSSEPQDGGASDRDATGSPRPEGPDREAPSRAKAALEPDGSGRSLEDELEEQAEAIRARARARREATRRRARGGDAPTGERPGSAADRERDESRADRGAVISVQSHRIELLPGNRNIIVNRRALVRGYLPSRRAGEGVILELLKDGRWVAIDRAQTIEDGRFYLAWYPSRTGYFRVRVRASASTQDPEPSGTRLLYVFRRAIASWYGPGFYGNRTACGQTFSSTLMGVAHKTLPCGYRLTVRYNGRARTIRVVDRGPYVHGRDYDLTEALRNYLGFDGVDEILATA